MLARVLIRIFSQYLDDAYNLSSRNPSLDGLWSETDGTTDFAKGNLSTGDQAVDMTGRHSKHRGEVAGSKEGHDYFSSGTGIL